MPAEKVAKAKTFKFPKSMGACADKLFEIRERRLAAQKVAEAIEAEEKALREHIINTLPKGDEGAVGKTHKVVVKTEEVPQVEDWEKFYAYIHKNKAWDLLQRRINPVAVADREADMRGKKLLPGTKKFTAVKISLTKK